jgi:glycosyltransferase involved in cell wall biosynthesis
MLPSVSVVVPLYNHDRFIAAALYSVFNQTHPAREIIVIDDGSSDASFSVLQNLAKSRPEMVIWRQRNRGAHNTINSAIHRSTSDLVAILNSDDEYEPNRLRVAASAFQADPGLDALATGLRCINQTGALTPNPWYDNALQFYRQTGNIGKALVNGNFVVTTSNLVARRKLFDEIGGFADLRYAHDLNFMLRLVSEGRRFKIIDDELLRYRTHDTNTISEGHDKVKVEWAMVTALYLYDLSRQSGSGSVAKFLDVLRKHNLTEAVLFLLAHLSRVPPRSVETIAALSDAELITIVREILS